MFCTLIFYENVKFWGHGGHNDRFWAHTVIKRILGDIRFNSDFFKDLPVLDVDPHFSYWICILYTLVPIEVELQGFGWFQGLSFASSFINKVDW